MIADNTSCPAKRRVIDSLCFKSIVKFKAECSKLKAKGLQLSALSHDFC